MRHAAPRDASGGLTKPDFATHFVRGTECFNALEFWEAHEAWEEIWLAAETEVEQFLQGLIQVAAAYHHLKRGTFRGGVRLFEAGLQRLRAFPPAFCDLDRAAVEEAAQRHREWAAQRVSEGQYDERLSEDDYPKLRLVITNRAPSPPFEPW